MTDTNSVPASNKKNKKNDKPEEAKPEAGAKSSEKAEEGAEKPKRTPVRRPIWVCVPVEFEMAETEEVDGDTKVTKLVQVPTRWTIKPCMGKKEVLAELTARGVDATNIDQVKLFRANPIEFEISNQLVVKF